MCDFSSSAEHVCIHIFSKNVMTSVRIQGLSSQKLYRPPTYWMSNYGIHFSVYVHLSNVICLENIYQNNLEVKGVQAETLNKNKLFHKLMNLHKV